MSSSTELNRLSGQDVGFRSTTWTEVGRARAGDLAARETLCARYWYPLYAYLRRAGHTREDAQDLVQGFLAQLLKREQLGGPDAQRGRFRTFLLTGLNGYVRDERARARAEKRGGGREHLSLEPDAAEDRYRLEPADPNDPAKLYERAWAKQVMEEAIGSIRNRWTRGGDAAYFDLLRPTLDGEKAEVRYAQIAVQRGVTESAVKKAVHDLRKALRNKIRELLSGESSSPSSVERDETDMRDFYASLTCCEQP